MPTYTLPGTLAKLTAMQTALAARATEHGTVGLYAFVPAFQTSLAAELTMLATDLPPAAEAAPTGPSLSDLQAQLHSYVDSVQSAWSFRQTGEAEPTWLHPVKYMPDAEFYAAFFAGLAGETAFVAWLDANAARTLADTQQLYATWQELVAAGASSVASEAYLRLHRAADLYAATKGVLRLYGMPTSAINAL